MILFKEDEENKHRDLIVQCRSDLEKLANVGVKDGLELTAITDVLTQVQKQASRLDEKMHLPCCGSIISVI